MESCTRRTGRKAVRASLTVALVVTAVLVATPAQAGRATCGLTVTSDFTLRSALRCSGTAINVELTEPGQVITIDLGRHGLIGDGTGSGVQVSGGIDGGAVVVRNGWIRGFDSAVGGNQVFDLTLERLRLRGNGTWLATTGGIAVRTLTIENTRVVDSGTSGADTESVTTVRRSHFVRSGIASPSQTYTYVYDSTFVGGGISTGIASNIVAERNRFARCDVGIRVADSWPNSPTVVRRNVFTGCRVGLEILGAAGPAPNGVTIAGNQFWRNAEEGFLFDLVFLGEMDVVGNRAIGNGGTGIAGTVEGEYTEVTLTRNTALRNGGHGIDVIGVVDGGGNVARGNATEPQCVGVICAARR